MCSVCGTNRNYQAAIEKLIESIEENKRKQAEKDEYNATAGPMDYDFDCCDYSYAQLENTIWKALQWLNIAPLDVQKMDITPSGS